MQTTHAPEMPHQELVEQAVQLSPQVLATVCEESRLLQVRYSLGQLAACTGSSELIAIAVQDIEDPHDRAIAHAKVGNIRRQESDAAQALAELQKLTDYQNVRRAPKAHELVELYAHFPDSTVLRGAAQHVSTGLVHKKFLLAALTGFAGPQERASMREELEDIVFKREYDAMFKEYGRNFHPEFLSFAARAVIEQITAVSGAKQETTSKFFENFYTFATNL